MKDAFVQIEISFRGLIDPLKRVSELLHKFQRNQLAIRRDAILNVPSASITYWRGRPRMIKMKDCPLHGVHCKAQDPRVFAMSHAGMRTPTKRRPTFIEV